jgi:hypothetical protein
MCRLLLFSYSPAEKFAAGYGSEKSGAFTKNPVYVTENNKREIDGISFGSGKTASKYGIYNPV